MALTHKTRGTPVGAAISLGVFSTLIIILYGTMAENSEDLFWDLFAFSGVIFMLPYLVMMLAFLKLRKTEPDAPRPYKVMGNEAMAKILASFHFLAPAATSSSLQRAALIPLNLLATIVTPVPV